MANGVGSILKSSVDSFTACNVAVPAAICPPADPPETIIFLIPGLMAVSIMNACLWGIGWNLIELRIKKLLRRMIATPLKKSVFLIFLLY